MKVGGKGRGVRFGVWVFVGGELGSGEGRVFVFFFRRLDFLLVLG